MIEPRNLRSRYRSLAPVYDDRRYKDPARLFHFGHDVRLIRRAILAFARHRHVLVDVACGTGQFTQAVADLFDNVIGVDLTPEMVSRAASKMAKLDHVRFVLASALALPLREECADAVITTRFLHLFPRDQHRTVLEALLPLLKPGGILIVEHDGPIFDRLRSPWRRLRRRALRPPQSYHPGEQPAGVQRLARWGASMPGLSAISSFAPRLADTLARAAVRAPFNQVAKFLVVVYRRAG
jgi:ubiquinone/menaquinone biosynthesis C-methylase UbiE